jgi:phosphatidylethanolamine-binding protein (PEBP) family uncharacterized protein
MGTKKKERFVCRISKPTLMAKDQLAVSSPAFPPEGEMPPQYTCDGKDMNPPRRVENIPAALRSIHQ